MYYLEKSEGVDRFPTGKWSGYSTLEEAITAAKKKVDDALPRNVIHVYKLVGYAYLAGDGTEEYKEIENSV